MKLQRSFMKGDFTITKEVSSGGYNMPYSHMHNSFEIYLLISGDRTVIIDDEKHKVAADDVTLFDKNIPHRSYGDAPYSGICIKFKDYYLNLYFTPLAKQELPVEGTEKAATIAEQLVSYVDNNYTSISNLSELTKLFNISESYIYKVFKTKFNTTPNKYIYNLRIDCACHWLEITDRTVKSIALGCGFKSSEHFMRVFKAHKGCTPKEYRKHASVVLS